MESKTDDTDISFIYDKSRRLRTSAEIVKEARMSVLLTGKGGARLVAATRRPETPAYVNDRWARRYASVKLLPMVSEMAPMTSRSTNSIQSELESPRTRLDPLPERSQSVCDSTEKRISSTQLHLRRRRPLSMVSTSVKCDAAFLNLRHDIESRKLMPDLPNVPPGESDSNVVKSVSLPSLPISTRTLESGYDSRLSSASIDEAGSIANDDERTPLSISPRINDNVQMHLKQLSSYCLVGNRSEEELDAWMDSFNACLASTKLATKRGQSRTLVLQSLFLALDETKPKLAIRVLAVILAINVSGNNLLKVCKVIYALCGNAENHVWFNHEIFLQHFVATLKRLSLSDSTSMLYLICSLDILSTNDPIRRRLLELPIFESITHVMHSLITRLPREEVQLNQIPTSAILTPTLSSIRTLLDAGRVAKQALLSQGVLPKIVYVMNALNEETDLVLYGMRTLSKLSLSEDCCEQLVNSEPDFFLCSSNWLRLYSNNQDIIVRLLFVLGNVLSVIERAQWQLFQAPGVVAAFQDIFDHFLALLRGTRGRKLSDGSAPSEDSVSTGDGCHGQSAVDPAKATAEIEDVLVKLARVVANLSVHPGIGSSLCQNEKILNHLCNVLELVVDHGESVTEELTVNALVALHNLAFYAMDDGLDPTVRKRLGQVVLAVMNTSSSVHAVSESCSLLANLTRDDRFCEWIMQKKVHRQLICFLTLNSSMQLSKSAAGTLINLSRFVQYRETLLDSGLLSKVFELLQRSITCYNWYLAALAIQIICNLVRASPDDRLNGNHVLNFIDRSVLRDIADLLLEHTDDATVTSPKELRDDELISQLRQVWEYEFCTASTELLETLDSQLS